MTKEERDALIERYASGTAEVVSSLEGFPPDKLATRAFPGKWSAAEIVHHLADSEMTSAIRLRRLLAEERPVIHGYDQEAFATRLRYAARDISPALDALRSARATTTQLLRTMSDEEWRAPGWHTEIGLYTAERWLEIYAQHAHGHAEQIRRLRAALSKS
ncbi:MAG: DinB family protein [Thermoanaerobaculaceae bacterium]|nr:DinB family protein [Thermoanaerobaculaceae bacterium]